MKEKKSCVATTGIFLWARFYELRRFGIKLSQPKQTKEFQKRGQRWRSDTLQFPFKLQFNGDCGRDVEKVVASSFVAWFCSFIAHLWVDFGLPACIALYR